MIVFVVGLLLLPVQVNYNDEVTVFTPQQIGGMFFSKMKELVQVSTGQKGCDMVLSVPPYYTDAQRHAVLDACKIGVRAVRCARRVSVFATVLFCVGCLSFACVLC